MKVNSLVAFAAVASLSSAMPLADSNNAVVRRSISSSQSLPLQHLTARSPQGDDRSAQREQLKQLISQIFGPDGFLSKLRSKWQAGRPTKGGDSPPASYGGDEQEHEEETGDDEEEEPKRESYNNAPKPSPAPNAAAPAPPKAAAPAPAPAPAPPKVAAPAPAPAPPAAAPPSYGGAPKGGLWQPAVGSKFQIILNAVPDVKSGPITPAGVDVYDVDMFNTPKETIKALQAQGKKVICYFSAGSSEDWREDYKDFQPADKGLGIAKVDGSAYWPGEKWLDIRKPNVRKIMSKRIQMAADKGCNGIDPDNMDPYGNKNGLGLTQADSVDFTRFLAKEAADRGLSTGLKNAMDILPQVQDVVQFAVNESCSEYGECGKYSNFLKTKPVFHIEYVDDKPAAPIAGSRMVSGVSSSPHLGQYCNSGVSGLGGQLSTVVKGWDLDGWVQSCDGSISNTRTVRT